LGNEYIPLSRLSVATSNSWEVEGKRQQNPELEIVC